MKKILLIIGILAILGAAAFFILNSKPANEEGESRVGFSIRDYLPFGNNDDQGDDSNINQPIDNPEQGNDDLNNFPDQTIPRLRKISSEPVAGAVIFNTGTTSIVRFVEKGTGNVYEAKSDTTNITRLTNTTIPKIIRAFWLPNGSGFLAQTLPSDSEVVETSFVKLAKNNVVGTEENLTPFSTTIGKLPTGIQEITIKPDGTKIFYYVVNGSHSDWYVSNPDGTVGNAVASNPLTEWLPKWLSGNKISMQTKGSSASLGYSYIFDISNGVLKKVGMGFPGISLNQNDDGLKSLVSSGSFPELYVQNNIDGSLTKTSLKTLADKCLWTSSKNPSIYCAIPDQLPGGNYPDIWYKGLVSTRDSIKKIGIDDDIYYNIADLTTMSEQQIDVADMSISSDETHLIFRNKIDGYLWMLRIEE